MIEWSSTALITPEANREIVAKNPLKPIGYNSSAKQCRVIKFQKDFTEDLIKEIMMNDNFTLWTYTEGTSNDL